jgi:dihydroxyacetone kinase
MTAVGLLLTSVADDVARAVDELNQLDGIAGDGDLGLTAQRAATAIRSAVESGASDLPTLLRLCGRNVAREAPSTAGTLAASGMLAAGAAARDLGTAGADAVGGTAALLRAAQEGIEKLGGAKIGDKTLLDALIPAVQRFSEVAKTGSTLQLATDEAATAARRGAAATATMEPRTGRAGWLPERSRGHVDAGAHLTALAFESAARHLASAISGTTHE